MFTNNTITNAHPAVVGGGGGIRRGRREQQRRRTATSRSTSRATRCEAPAARRSPCNKLGGTGTYSGTIANNIVGATGVQGSGSLEGSGIFVLSDGGGTYTASITGNTVRQYDNDGIFMQTGGSGVIGSGTMNVTVTGNTVTEPETQVSGALATNGFHLNGGATVGDTLPDLREPERKHAGRQRTGHDSSRKHVRGLPPAPASIDDGAAARIRGRRDR